MSEVNPKSETTLKPKPITEMRSSFVVFWIFGCFVGMGGMLFSNPSSVWTGLALLMVGIVAEIVERRTGYNRRRPNKT